MRMCHVVLVRVWLLRAAMRRDPCNVRGACASGFFCCFASRVRGSADGAGAAPPLLRLPARPLQEW